MLLTKDYQQNVRTIDTQLRVGVNFDINAKENRFGSLRVRFYMLDGFVKDNILERVNAFILEHAADVSDAQEFCQRFITYGEIDVLDDTDDIFTQILAGNVAMLVEGMDKVVIISAKAVMIRAITEPNSDQVLRGSRDGFIEALVINTSLIRKRIRDTNLTMELFSVGSVSRTDVVLCYMDNLVNKRELNIIRKKLQTIRTHAVTMGHESIAEELKEKAEWNPFPRIRYTERPDIAASNVANGRIVLLMDNSPVAMILPTYFFDFVLDSNDYYFPPLLGTYIRLLRLVVFMSTVFLVPVWFLLSRHPEMVPSWLDFVKIENTVPLPVIWQLIVVELAIGGLRTASLNTPSALSNSFSIIGALILGELSIQMKCFVPQVIVFMGFAAISNFSQPSFELGYAFKFYRILLYILVELADVWGFVGGVVLMLVTLAVTRTITGGSYLYPLIPFNGRELFHTFVRKRLSQKTR
ncbi:MAG: spore germination protein [Clostridia bacterium]|nr:spore germination protein [Clostridia bacterium]